MLKSPGGIPSSPPALFTLISFSTSWTLTWYKIRDAGFSHLYFLSLLLVYNLSVRTYVYCRWKIDICIIQNNTSVIVRSMSYNIDKGIIQSFCNLLVIVYGYTLRGETFTERYREVKNSRNFSNKLSRMISDDAFRGNFTFANVYFKC